MKNVVGPGCSSAVQASGGSSVCLFALLFKVKPLNFEIVLIRQTAALEGPHQLCTCVW